MVTHVGEDGTAQNFRPVSNIRASMNYLHLLFGRYTLLRTLPKTLTNAKAIVTAIDLSVLPDRRAKMAAKSPDISIQLTLVLLNPDIPC